MNEFDRIQQLKEALELLSLKLQEEADKRQEEADKREQTYKALKEIFPIELYKNLRPDVERIMPDDDATIHHFIEKGINEIDLRGEITEDSWFSTKQIAHHILTDCRPHFSKIQNATKASRLILSKTFGNHSELKDNVSHNFAKQHTIIHPQSNTVCTWIPKNACSSLRFSFAKANGLIRSKDDIQWIHKNNQSFNADNKELLNADYTFTILRDPFERILSYFLDKICHPNSDNDHDKSYGHAKRLFKTSEDTNFESFIESIHTHPTLILEDIHTTPQCNFLIYENYDDYFSTESMEEAKSRILSKTGIQLEDTRGFNGIHTSKGLSLSELFGPETTINHIKDNLAKGLTPKPQNMFTQEMIRKTSLIYLGDIILYESVISGGHKLMNKWIS